MTDLGNTVLVDAVTGFLTRLYVHHLLIGMETIDVGTSHRG